MRRPFRLLASTAAALGFMMGSASAPFPFAIARAFAQQPGRAAVAPTRTMRLSDAIAYAAARQPQTVAARARVAAARADARVPRAQWYPYVGAAAELVVATTNNTTATQVGTGGVLDVARVGATPAVTGGQASLEPAPTTLVGVGLAQEVFDFGRIAAQSAAFDAAAGVAEHDARATELNVQFAVESAYFAVQAAKSVVTAAEGAYARALAHRDLAKAGVESGLRPPLELTRAEADLKRFEVGRIRADGGLTAARAQFAAAVGVPEAQLDTADEGGSASDLPSADAAVESARHADPLILAAEARLREQAARTRAIRAEMRPNIWLTGTFTMRGGGAEPSSGDPLPGGGWVPSVPNWDVGLVLSWRAFDATILARADASRARELVRAAELDSVRQLEVAGVQRAHAAAAVAAQTVPALQRAREAAQANYAQVEARFKSGLATGIELADAEALRTESEIQEAIGRFEASRSRAALLHLMGERRVRPTPQRTP